jgi:hypothetical protein
MTFLRCALVRAPRTGTGAPRSDRRPAATLASTGVFRPERAPAYLLLLPSILFLLAFSAGPGDPNVPWTAAMWLAWARA